MHAFKDHAAPASGWLARAYYTPVSDAIRGRLTGRLDLRREIAAAALPPPLATLVGQVVRRTRLSRSEKIDVARELAAHFADGLAGGRTAEQLTADFGSGQQAAQLIRRAKLRARSLFWRWVRAIKWTIAIALACAILLYGALAARFYTSRPKIARNIWQEINASRKTAEQDRAWPIYRTAVLKLGKQGKLGFETEWTDEGPAGKHWDDLLAALARHRETIELARAGAKKPRLGLLVGDAADRDAFRAAGATWIFQPTMPLADENQELIDMDLNAMNALRSLAWLLSADARRAAFAGEGATVVEDVDALLAISAQTFQPSATLVEQLVGGAICSMAMHSLGLILADTPQVLSETELRDLAHRIAGYRGGRIAYDPKSEQMWFDDLLQRAFTDDGHGDGRLAPGGAELLAKYAGGPMMDWSAALRTFDQRISLASQRVVEPGLASLVGSRLANEALYREIMQEEINAHQGPPWEWAADADDRLQRIAADPILRIRYMPVVIFLPAVSAVYRAAQSNATYRQATQVGIALVLWQRRHGAWPARLDLLVPDLLPSVPLDPFDGQPLRYALGEGQPVVYSVGDDRDDDGGSPTDRPDQLLGQFGRLDSRTAQNLKQAENDGDWILWPPLKQTSHDD